MALTQVNQGLLGEYAQYTGFKNRIINGAMVIDQRYAGAAWGTAVNGFTVDRWFVQQNGFTGKINGGQNYNSITPPAGFKNYIGVQSQSAYSVGASEFAVISQSIEGYNWADMGFGTANAATVTLSFWVQSSLTGTFGGAIRGYDGAATIRGYPFTYNIPVANTWTHITISVPGDTVASSAWTSAQSTTNGYGLILTFGLGVGSNYSGTAGSWTGTGNPLSATGATSVVGTNGATFYITGVQLEKGSTATSFDYRPYGTELQLCQRYLPCLRATAQYSSAGFIGSCSNANTGYVLWSLPVKTRVPATGFVASSNLFYGDVVAIAGTVSSQTLSTTATVPQTTVDSIGLTVGISAATAGRGLFLMFNSSTDYIYFTGCEL